jgi:hypothetical protein
MTRRIAVAAGAAGVLVAAVVAAQMVNRPLADRRLDAPRSLQGTFLFTPPDSPDTWAARARFVRRQVQVAEGLWPMPEATPLNAVVHGRVARDGYTVDRVFFESLPGHFVTGSLYRPTGRMGKLPAVLLPHGHWAGGRFNEASVEDVRKAIVSGAERFEVGGRYPLQAAAVQLARMGVVSFLFDLEGYADSLQIPIRVAHGEPDGRPKDSPAAPGLFFSADAESRLESIMGLQSWNARRALDFLASLPDVDPSRLAVSGASGGGTQTFILGALDDRPVTLFPMVMLGTKMQGGCTCENADYLRIGSGNVEIASLWAPRPLGMTTADDWTKTLPETGFPAMQKLWAMLGAKDNVQVFPLPQFPHNYNYVSRATMYAWMNRQLKLGLPEPIVEDDFKPLTREEATVWTADHPAPAKGELEERRVTSWWASVSDRALSAALPRDTTSLAGYREIVGGALTAMLGGEIPGAGDVTAEPGAERRNAEGGIAQRGTLHVSQSSGETALVQLTPRNPSGAVAVWVDAHGGAGLFDANSQPRPAVGALLAAGVTVIGVDVGGGDDVRNSMVPGAPIAPYTYGYNSPLIAQRVHDVLAALRFARSGGLGPQESVTLTAQSPTEAADQREDRHAGTTPAAVQPGAHRVYLLGFGKDAGVWASLARAGAPDLVDRTAVDTGGFRFSSVTAIDDAAMLPGAVKYGDLPGFLALATTPLWLAGEGQTPSVVSAAFKAAGVPNAVTLAKGGPQAEMAAVKWLTSGRPN